MLFKICATRCDARDTITATARRPRGAHFTRVAEAGVAAGLDVTGFCTQAGFLLATGIESFVAEAVGTVEATRRAGEARRLLMPGEMGEAFKVMALTRDYDTVLDGFALQDLRHSL